MGKIQPIGYIQPAKGFYLASGRFLRSAQHRPKGQTRPCCMRLVSLPRARSTAGEAQQLDSSFCQLQQQRLLLNAAVCLTTPAGLGSMPSVCSIPTTVGVRTVSRQTGGVTTETSPGPMQAGCTQLARDGATDGQGVVTGSGTGGWTRAGIAGQ